MAPLFQPTKGQLINTGEIEAVGTVKAKDSAIQGIKRGNLDSRAVRAFPHVVNADSLAPGVGGIELQAIRKSAFQGSLEGIVVTVPDRGHQLRICVPLERGPKYLAGFAAPREAIVLRSEEHTSELQSPMYLV